MRLMTVHQMKKMMERLPDEVHVTDLRIKYWYEALDEKDKYEGIKNYDDLPELVEGATFEQMRARAREAEKYDNV